MRKWCGLLASIFSGPVTQCKQQITVVLQCRHCHISSLSTYYLLSGFTHHMLSAWPEVEHVLLLFCRTDYVLMYFETMQFGQATYRFAVNTTQNNMKVLINLVVDWNRNGCKTFKLKVPKVCNFPYESSYLSHSLYLDDTFLDGNDDRQSIRHFTAFNKQVTSRSNLAYCTALAERYSHQTSCAERREKGGVWN